MTERNGWRGAEQLEPRRLLSVSASAQITLVSTTGTQANPVYNYDITVTNTGTTNVGTFWFSWVPGEDFLPSVPSSTSHPTGWTNTLTGTNDSSDGTAIEWVASSNPIPSGQSLSGFDFSTTDSPAVLAQNSPTHSTSQTLTSFVYVGAPLADPGFQLVVSQAAVTPPPSNLVTTTTTLNSSAPTALAGASVVLTATVTPSTQGAAPTGTVNFTVGGTSVGSAPVQTDGTAALTTTTLPAGSDPVIATYSGDTTYSTSASTPFTETITATASLSPTITKTTLPTALVSGTAMKGVATVSIANVSAAAEKGKATIAVYASTTGGIDGSSILLGQVAKNVNAATGKPLTQAVPLHGTLPAGSYTLFARVTDPSSNSADSPAGGAVDVAAPFITLSETLASSSLPTSATANSKSHGAVLLDITNAGNITTSSKTTLALFATTNGVVDGSAVQLATVALPLKIKPGKSSKASIPLKLIPAIAAGSYTVVAQVTDQNGGISTVMVGSLTITG